MSELRWGPLWGRCSACGKPTELIVDTDHHPHLSGRIGVRCDLCGKLQAYNFEPSVEGEMAAQARLKAEAEKHRATLREFDPEEWHLFQCAMFGLMPQPAAPDEFIPDDATLFRWRLLRDEHRAGLVRAQWDYHEEGHEQYKVIPEHRDSDDSDRQGDRWSQRPL